VTSVTPADGGFTVEFAEESPVLARQVIVATGVLPYASNPALLHESGADVQVIARRPQIRWEGRIPVRHSCCDPPRMVPVEDGRPALDASGLSLRTVSGRNAV
jgi:hypothetical protein